MTDEKKVAILIKAWETYQNISKGFGENCWKIRAIGIGFWSTVIAYGYQTQDKNVYFFSFVIILMFFVLEIAIRQLQYKYISKSIDIEKSINDYLVGDEIMLPQGGISTNIEVPTIDDFTSILQLKRWLIWFPYIVLVVFTALLLYMNV
jgi:hypothetical protein